MDESKLTYRTLLYDGDFMIGARTKKERRKLLKAGFHSPDDEEYDEWFDLGEDLHSIH